MTTKPDSRYIGKTMTQIRADDARLLQMPTTTRCAHCRWTHIGTASEGQAAFGAHLEEKHPEVKPVKRRRHGFSMRLAAHERERAREAARRGGKATT